VTAQIVAALEKGANPWRKPWTSQAGGAMPHNAASGHEYRGVNVWSLWLQQNALGYATAQWLTFNQARQLGGSVKRGEKATIVVFNKRVMVKARAGEKADATGRKPIYMLRYFSVFNVAQCESLTLPAREQPEQSSTVTADHAAAIHALAAARGITVQHGGDSAFYLPSMDYVSLPKPEQFKTATGYAATLAHELTHATGHGDRLDRDLTGTFGSPQYAREELVAELGSAMLCAELGFSTEHVESHAAYLDSWLSLLRSDDRAIFTASKAADTACDWLLGRTKEEQQPAEVAAA
jgi:antirestriction protein ArdC